MLVQAGALALLVAGDAFVAALGAAVLLGIGTALVYPTLIAAVSDAVQPVERAQVVGVPLLARLWLRDRRALGRICRRRGRVRSAIGIVAGLTAASGIWVAFTRWAERDRSADHLATRRNVDELLRGLAERDLSQARTLAKLSTRYAKGR